MSKIPVAGRTLYLFALAVVLAPAALPQPALPTGDRTGSIAWRDAEPVALTAALEECVEGLKLTLRSEDGTYRTEEVVHVEGAEVHFGFTNTARNYALACAPCGRTAAPTPGRAAPRTAPAPGSASSRPPRPPSAAASSGGAGG